MTGLGPDTVFNVFLLFCRIGACLMVLPGFSSAHLPMQVRLLLAVAITLALTPPLLPLVGPVVASAGPEARAGLIMSEFATGAMIGFMGRCFFLALEFIGAAMASFLGFTGMPGVVMEESEPSQALTSMITLTATVMIFVTDLHQEVLKAIFGSYQRLPLAEPFNVRAGLIQITDAVARAFLIALQIGSPFLIYSVIINILFGIANKLIPQVPIYFISVPFVLAGGFVLLIVAIGEFMRIFMAAFGGWLAAG